MSEDESVLFANDAFYNAFASSDLQAMEEIWARDAQPTCVHPGWLPLVGRRQVMKIGGTSLKTTTRLRSLVQMHDFFIAVTVLTSSATNT